MDRLLAGLTALQLAEWQAYDRIIDEDRTRESLALRAQAGLDQRRGRRKGRG